MRKIRMLIPEKVKCRLKAFISSSHEPEFYQYANFEGKKIFIFLAGFYQNLGDMALTYAQDRFLEQIYPEAKIIIVPSSLTYQSIRTIRKIIRPDDLITILGGGNMDDMYISLEEARLFTVESFPHHKIVLFPQTMAFSDTDFGRRRQEISRKVYEKHPNLTIFVRERYSLERIKKAFPGVITGFCPDIVLSLNKTEPKCERSEIVCCMRSDKEQQTTNEEKKNVEEIIRERFPEAVFTDTVNVSPEDCTPERYEQTLERFWELLRRSKLVVTDRLHCMIFCVITGTPCIVMDNSNKKISGVYDAWLIDTDYVTLLKSFEPEQFSSAIDMMLFKKNNNNQTGLKDQFISLKNACLL